MVAGSGDPRMPAPRAVPGGRDQRRAGAAPGRRRSARSRGRVAVADAAGDATDAGPVVTDNPAESRYDLHLGGELAGSVRDHLRGQQITLLHTEVAPRFHGAGLATPLAPY